MSTPTGFDTWTMTDGAPVTLNGTEYAVRHQTYANGHVNTTLRGPRGGLYFLAAPLAPKGGDTGRRAVVSVKSGNPLRDKAQRPVWVLAIGDVIEEVAR